MLLKRGLLSSAMALVMCASTSHATPSTQIWIPSTDVQGFLKPHLGWDVYLPAKGNGLVSNGGLTVGVLPWSKLGLEIGVDYRDVGGSHRDPVYFNAKLGMPEDALFKYMPALAIGGYDFGLRKASAENLSALRATAYNVGYAMVAKTIWKLGRFSAGYYQGNEKLLTAPDGKKDNRGALVSWDRVMTELSEKLWLAVDFQSGKNSYGAVSFGASWLFAPNVGLLVGYDIYNNTALSQTVTIQFDVNMR